MKTKISSLIGRWIYSILIKRLKLLNESVSEAASFSFGDKKSSTFLKIFKHLFQSFLWSVPECTVFVESWVWARNFWLIFGQCFSLQENLLNYKQGLNHGLAFFVVNGMTLFIWIVRPTVQSSETIHFHFVLIILWEKLTLDIWYWNTGSTSCWVMIWASLFSWSNEYV